MKKIIVRICIQILYDMTQSIRTEEMEKNKKKKKRENAFNRK